jgi:hypothetical protein
MSNNFIVTIILLIVLCGLLYIYNNKKGQNENMSSNYNSGDEYAAFDPRPIFERLSPYSGALAINYPDYYTSFPWNYSFYFPYYPNYSPYPQYSPYAYNPYY